MTSCQTIRFMITIIFITVTYYYRYYSNGWPGKWSIQPNVVKMRRKQIELLLLFFPQSPSMLSSNWICANGRPSILGQLATHPWEIESSECVSTANHKNWGEESQHPIQMDPNGSSMNWMNDEMCGKVSCMQTWLYQFCTEPITIDHPPAEIGRCCCCYCCGCW